MPYNKSLRKSRKSRNIVENLGHRFSSRPNYSKKGSKRRYSR